MEREVIILAGGLGTRLKSVIDQRPKAMAPIEGRPFIDYLLKFLLSRDVSRFILATGHLSEMIVDHINDDWPSIEKVFSIEGSPLGTGGAIRQAMQLAHAKDVLVVNGDTLFLSDIDKHYRLHSAFNADVSLALKPLVNFDRYGTVELNENSRIMAFREKQWKLKGLINGGTYLINKEAFMAHTSSGRFSFETDFMEKSLDNLRLFGYEDHGYFIDIGVPEDYERAQHELPGLAY